MLTYEQSHCLAEEQIGPATVVTVACSELLEEPLIRGIGQQLFRLADHANGQHLIVNLREVIKLSTMMLGTFIALNRYLRSMNRRLVLCGIHSDLRPIFKTFRITSLMPIYDDEQQALQAL